jgi:hypothetical protein
MCVTPLCCLLNQVLLLDSYVFSLLYPLKIAYTINVLPRLSYQITIVVRGRKWGTFSSLCTRAVGNYGVKKLNYLFNILYDGMEVVASLLRNTKNRVL